MLQESRSYPKHLAQNEMSKVRFNKKIATLNKQSKSKGVTFELD